VQIFLLFVLDVRSLVCRTWDASWSMVVTYSAWLKRGAPAFSHWTDETVGRNKSAVMTLSLTERLSKLSCRRCDCTIQGRLFVGCNCKSGVNLVMEKPWCLMMRAQTIYITSYLLRKCLFGDPGAVSVSLFCPVESCKLERKVLWWCGLVGGWRLVTSIWIYVY
jgi:hypothetical protein